MKKALKVIAIIAAIAFLVTQESAAEKKAKKAAEAAEGLAESANEAKQALEDIKSAFNGYDTAVAKLNECTKGTKEWRDALQAVNQEVLDIIANNPELASRMEISRDANGMMVINNKDEILQAAQDRANYANYASMMGNVTAKQAQDAKNAEDLIRSYVLAGFTKIHIDTSMKVADDDPNTRLSDETISRRGAHLARVAEDAYQELLKTGAQVIVLDHHDLVPSVLAIQKKIHLVSSMNDYDNPHLCGAGVTLKFCLYLDELMETGYAQDYYDLAACGICGDMMNVGVESLENRYICSKGFSNLINPAIEEIKGTYPMCSDTIAYSVAPLVNAANRMNRNWEALKLFLSEDEDEIHDLIDILKRCKESQNERVERVYEQIERQIKEQEDKKVMFFVLEDADNISGLVANKVLGEYQNL